MQLPTIDRKENNKNEQNLSYAKMITNSGKCYEQKYCYIK